MRQQSSNEKEDVYRESEKYDRRENDSRRRDEEYEGDYYGGENRRSNLNRGERDLDRDNRRGRNVKRTRKGY